MRSLTAVLLTICAVMGALIGLNAYGNAQSAVHEIEGMIGFLIFTVAVAAGYIVTAIDGKK